jgi:hypothetical protein
VVTSLALTLVVGGMLGIALRSGRRVDLIGRHPYNNRHSDATAARDGRLLGGRPLRGGR